MIRPKTGLPIKPITKSMGWCDAPADRNYNRLVKKPYPASHENLWREDEIYDLVITLNHNQRPRIKGKGSAIFIHIAKKGYPPTEGCLALKKSHLLRLIAEMTPATQIII